MAAALHPPVEDSKETSPFDLSPAIALLHSLSYFHPSTTPELPTPPAPVTSYTPSGSNIPIYKPDTSDVQLFVPPVEFLLPIISRKNPFQDLLSDGAVNADAYQPIGSIPIQSAGPYQLVKSIPVQSDTQSPKKNLKPSVRKIIKLGAQQRRSQPSSKRSTADPTSPVKQTIINIGFFESIKKLLSTGYRSLPNIYLSLDTLVNILETGRPTEKKVIAGSTKSQALVSSALRLGYEWNYLERVEKFDEPTSRGYRSDPSSNESLTKRIVEQAVDEIIVLKMYESLFDYAPGTMVLATGDGNSTEFSEGFYGAVQRSLASGWTVQLFAWKRTLSRSWKKIRSPNFKIYLLDEHIFELIETQ
ncbi:hypothetical protein AA313_de0204144 [Arthrobotrys entomopaga]|nr:hypothetical protein AA313_de0204144 [Arthrobotrys entomopaga]